MCGIIVSAYFQSSIPLFFTISPDTIFFLHTIHITILYKRTHLYIPREGRAYSHHQPDLYSPFSLYLHILSHFILSMFELSKRGKTPPTLKRIISKALHCSRRKVFISDKRFDLVADMDMGAFLVFDETNEKEWKAEIWDCDNFSLQFAAAAQRYFVAKGINPAVGIIWTDEHAFNISVNPNFKVRLWEPQTDMECWLNARVKLVII